MRLKPHATLRLLSISITLLFRLSATAFAQGSPPAESSHPSFLIGPVATASWNDHTGTFRPIDNSDCPVFDNGSGWGYGFGLSVEIYPKSKKKSTWSINPAVSYEERPATTDWTISGVAGVTGQWSHITYSLLNTEIMYKQEIARIGSVGIGIKIGPAFQYVIQGTLQQRNLTGYKATICFDGDIPDKHPTRFGMKGGIECNISLWTTLVAVPGVYYDRGLTSLLESGGEWYVHSLSFQIGLLIPM